MRPLEPHKKRHPKPAGASQTVIRAGWLIDGQGSRPQADQWISIEKGAIVSIAPAPPERPALPGAMDFSHATIIPALMDAHVHLAFSGTTDAATRKAQLSSDPQKIMAWIARHMADHLKCGIAAVRDGGDKNGCVMAGRKQNPQLHVAATCWAWHCAGRYGGMIGRPFEEPMAAAGTFAAPLQGADHIKVIHSGLNSIDHFGRQTAPQFSAGQLTAMAALSSQHNLPMMVHANGQSAVAMAIAAGARSIEHGYFMGPDNIQRMADQQVFWVPTATPMAALSELDTLKAAQADVASQTLDHQLAQIGLARQQGVPIVLGTDAGAIGVQHGTAVAQEMALLRDAGLPIEQAIRSACLNAAKLMGLHNRGALCKGWRADLIAVSGPPEDLPENLASIEAIWIKGEKI